MSVETKAAQPVGDYDLRGRHKKQGYVYVAGYQPHPDVLYIKAGKTNRPKERVRDYGGMIPCGLTFMRAAPVETPNRSERALLTAIASIDGVEPVGGEWFRCVPLLKLTVLDELHRIADGVFQVHTHCPAPSFSMRNVGGGK